MIPQAGSNIDFETNETTIQPSKTYRLDIVNKRIVGMTDGVEAYKISVEKALLTQRYAHSIYSGQYGSILHKYIGKEFDFIEAELPAEIHEALKHDDRYHGITDFIITKTGIDSCKISFNVISTEGTVPIELDLRS